MQEDDFIVKSLESIGTLEQDRDVGVVRVAAGVMQKVGRRNSLVRVTVIRPGEKPKHLIRIMRAATGLSALRNGEIALQYDDRVDLGIDAVNGSHRIRIEPVNEWLALPQFLLGHSSPLVRRDAVFGLVLMALGCVIGFFLGLLASSWT